MHEALVVADDLTGAADAGDRFAARGFPTAVRTADADSGSGSPGDDRAGAPTAGGDPAVLVVDTDSRYAHPAEAADRVGAAVEAHPAGVVYKKVDSTLRGNVVAEVDAALAAAGADLAVVAPAFPGQGRTTVDGVHRVDGTPVAEVVSDPDSPVRTSDLVELFADSDHAVVRVPLETVNRGPAAVRTAFRQAVDDHGTAVAVADAEREDDLDAVAEAGDGLDGSPVYVGSAGLSGHVRLPGTAKRAPGAPAGRDDRPAPDEGGVLGVVGSVADPTLAQLAALEADAVVRLGGPTAVTDPDAAADAAAAAAAERLAAGERAVVTAALDPGDVEATLAAAGEAGVDEAAVRERVATALGRVVPAVRERAGVGGLLLSGGAVAREALGAVDARGVRLTGRSVAAGIPLGRIDGGAADGTPVVTKAGAFGGDETIVNCLDVLGRDDD